MSNSGPGVENPKQANTDELAEKQERAVLEAIRVMRQNGIGAAEADRLANAIVDATRKLAEAELY